MDWASFAGAFAGAFLAVPVTIGLGIYLDKRGRERRDKQRRRPR